MTTPDTLDLDSLLADTLASAPADTRTQAEIASANRAAQRAGATQRNRQQRAAQHNAALSAVGGDPERLKTIQLWVPRSKRTTLFAKGFEKLFVGSLKRKDDQDHDQVGAKAIYSHSEQEYEAEIDETVYDLTQVEVERAAPPADEIAYAKLQGRFKPHQPAINSFFAPESGVRYAADVTSHCALGDFEWCEDLVPRHEREQVRQRYPLQHRSPVRTINEGSSAV